MQLKAFIFDLDGVLTDTAKFHYQAWKRLADEMGAEFNWEINHQLRGVSRRQSMEIIFKDHDLSKEEIKAGMARKNDYYQSLILRMSPSDVLPGAMHLLQNLRENDVKIGLGSASKNAQTVLDAIGLTEDYNRAIEDFNQIENPRMVNEAGEIVDATSFMKEIDNELDGLESVLVCTRG